MKKLSPVDHIALQTRDIKSTVNWYSNNFECEPGFLNRCKCGSFNTQKI